MKVAVDEYLSAEWVRASASKSVYWQYAGSGVSRLCARQNLPRTETTRL